LQARQSRARSEPKASEVHESKRSFAARGERVSLSRQLAIVAVVYVVEGFPMGVFADVWPVYFRREGASLAAIGWLTSLSLAWSLKVLWSPLVDRFGERRRWIAACLAAMSGALFVFAGVEPGEVGALAWLAIGLFCLASATQDVAIDAYTIGLVDRGREGPANSVRITAYRVGLIAAGGMLLLPRWVGWSGAFLAAALGLLAFAAAVLACPRVAVPEAARREFLPALRRWLVRPGLPAVAGFVLLYRVGDRAMGPMVSPFWVDSGLSNEEIALAKTTLGTLATVAGAVAGGAAVARIGIGRALAWLGALALLSNLGYAAAAAAQAGRAGVIAASVVESFCGGLASAAFLSYLMRICEKEHAAVQYALVTSLYALAGTLVATPSGWVTERTGYAAYFALTAAFALPAFLFLPGARGWLGAEPALTPARRTARPPDPPRS
jgi:PAT family beta-lactamase induction signal transducer AmpG